MNLNNLFPALRTYKSDPDVLRDLRSEVTRVFDDFNRMFPIPENLDLAKSAGYFGQPKIDISETDKEIDVVVDVPGVRESDIEVQIDGKTLTIKGERSEEKKEDKKDYKVVERSYGSFMRSITLPFEADSDKIAAKLDAGVLTLSIKKPKEVAGKVKTVKISTAQGTETASKKGNAGESRQSKTAEKEAASAS